MHPVLVFCGRRRLPLCCDNLQGRTAALDWWVWDRSTNLRRQIAAIRIKTFVRKSCSNLSRIFGKLLIIISIDESIDGWTDPVHKYATDQRRACIFWPDIRNRRIFKFFVFSVIINSERVLIIFDIPLNIYIYIYLSIFLKIAEIFFWSRVSQASSVRWIHSSKSSGRHIMNL